jgi:hypothetical protein
MLSHTKIILLQLSTLRLTKEEEEPMLLRFLPIHGVTFIPNLIE